MHKEHPRVKILAMSGAANEMLLKAAQLMGSHSVLLKPVKQAALQQAITMLLGGLPSATSVS